MLTEEEQKDLREIDWDYINEVLNSVLTDKDYYTTYEIYQKLNDLDTTPDESHAEELINVFSATLDVYRGLLNITLYTEKYELSAKVRDVVKVQKDVFIGLTHNFFYFDEALRSDIQTWLETLVDVHNTMVSQLTD